MPHERPSRNAPPSRGARVPLTGREQEVAALLAARRTTAEIAEALGISRHTVRRHVERVLEKLGLHSRLEVERHVRVGRGGRAGREESRRPRGGAPHEPSSSSRRPE